jgi:hypothetical protein
MSKPRAPPDRPLSRDPHTVFRTYLAQCRRLGVTPAPSARQQIKAWVAELARQQQQPAQIDAGDAHGTADMPR